MLGQRSIIDLVVSAIALAVVVAITVFGVLDGLEAFDALDQCQMREIACDESSLSLAATMLVWGSWVILGLTVAFIVALFVGERRSAWFSVLAAVIAAALVGLASWLANASILPFLPTPPP